MEKLRKLLLVVLSSDQAGEVMAATAAIAKLLRKHGKDIHWLVDRATVSGSHKGLGAQPYPPPTGYGAPSHWMDKLVYCADRWDRLSKKQCEFIESLVLQRDEQLGKVWQPSVAQQAWLNDIYKKLKSLETFGAG